MMQFIEALVSVAILISQNVSGGKKPEMYLCLDSMMHEFKVKGKTPPKLVYGYINGKKTECMCEQNLLALYNDSLLPGINTTKEPDCLKKAEKTGNDLSKGAKPKKSAFFGKDLAGKDLKGEDLKGVDFSGADLSNAILESTDLRNANLSGANLSGACLENAFLKNANLKNADLSNARLKGAYFHNADLSDAKGLSLEQIRVTATVYNAVFDSDLIALIKEYCPNKLKDPGWQWHPTVFVSDSLIPEDQRVSRKSFK